MRSLDARPGPSCAPNIQIYEHHLYTKRAVSARAKREEQNDWRAPNYRGRAHLDWRCIPHPGIDPGYMYIVNKKAYS